MQVNIVNRPDKPEITQKDNTLISSAVSGNQWYVNDDTLKNDTSRVIAPLNPGKYYVITNNGVCTSEFSNVIDYGVNSINTDISSLNIKVYPNPTTDKINIEYTGKTNTLPAYKFI